MTLLQRLRLARLRRFPSYDAALAECGSGYNAEELQAHVVKATQAYVQEQESRPLGFLEVRELFVLYSLRLAHLRVLDFGGAAGQHYFIARHNLPMSFRWTVVDVPAMVKQAGVLANDELSFHDSISDALARLGQIDLVFSSSTVQYVSRPYQVLEELMVTEPSAMYLTRTSLTEGKGFVTIQPSRLSQNGPAHLHLASDPIVKYPHTVMERQQVEGLFKKHFPRVVQIDEVPHWLGPGFLVRGYVGYSN